MKSRRVSFAEETIFPKGSVSRAIGMPRQISKIETSVRGRIDKGLHWAPPAFP